jgi:hypothetical protein
MSNQSPGIQEILSDPIGLDKVLFDLQRSFMEIPWLEGNVFRRAYDNTFKRPGEDKQATYPMVYKGGGEYYNATINDNLPCALFFRTVGVERIAYEKPDASRIIPYERTVSLVFWCSLDRLNVPFKSDGIYTENIKVIFMEKLGLSSHVSQIINYVDEPMEEVFDGYDLPDTRQLSMFPFAGIRINFNVSYKMPVKPC